MSNNNGLLIAGALGLGAYLLMNSNNSIIEKLKEIGGGSGGSGGSQGGGASVDLSGLFEGLSLGGSGGSGLDNNDVFAALQNAFSQGAASVTGAAGALTGGLGGALTGGGAGLDLGLSLSDISGALKDAFNKGVDSVKGAAEVITGGGGGQGAGGSGSQGAGQANTIPNILNALGDNTMKIGQGAAWLGGTYLTVRAAGPIAPAVGQGVAMGVRTAAPYVAGSIGSALGALGTSVAALPVVGVAAASIAAGGAGYGAGTLFNQTPAGQSLIQNSSNIGAKLGSSNTGLGQLLFPKAQLTQSATDYAASPSGAAAIAAIQAARAAGNLGAPAPVSSFNQATVRIKGGAR